MFTKYMFNTLSFNPAYAGTKDYLSATAIVRDQWLTWNKGTDSYGGGAPVTYTANVHSPFKQNTGLGAYLSQDRIGSTAYTDLRLCYAYRLRAQREAAAVARASGWAHPPQHELRRLAVSPHGRRRI